MVMTGTSAHSRALSPWTRVIASPTERASGTNPGKEVATLATSRISIGACGAQARDGKGHGDAVIAEAVDLPPAERGPCAAALDPHAVRQHRMRHAQRGQSGAHGGNAIALLDPQFFRAGYPGLALRASRRDEQHRKLVDGQRTPDSSGTWTPRSGEA